MAWNRRFLKDWIKDRRLLDRSKNDGRLDDTRIEDAINDALEKVGLDCGMLGERRRLPLRAGEWQVPIVIRMPYGGYIQGGPYHSQSIEGFLSHCPGLKVVIPSNAADAKGLLKTAIRDPNPVVFLEHKALYRQQKFCARVEPSKEYLVPFGEASIAVFQIA